MKHVSLDYTHALRQTPGQTKLISPEDIEQLRSRVEAAHAEIAEERSSNPDLSFLSLPYAYAQTHGETILADTLWGVMDTISAKCAYMRKNCSDYVQIAIGGSALGSITLINALGDGLDPREPATGCRVHVPDNIDPEWIGKMLNQVDMKNVFVSAISKSGNTVETLANFFVFYEALKNAVGPAEVKERVVIMTDPLKGTLADLCGKEGFTLIPIPGSVHGRFSVLSPGGLFAAAVSGVDIEGLLAGARSMDRQIDGLGFWENPALLYASIHYLANTNNAIDTLVLMPYSHGLRTIADWYSQLVAESLGKEGIGMTPVKALGATDQHSQLQLYNDGPKNKLITFFCLDEYRQSVQIPSQFPSCEDFRYLWGHSLNQLLDSEQAATAFSLAQNGVPSCALRAPELSAFYMGELFILLERVVCLLGELYGVNAFNQPGVEESKEYARAMLGKDGEKYERIREDLASAPAGHRKTA